MSTRCNSYKSLLLSFLTTEDWLIFKKMAVSLMVLQRLRVLRSSVFSSALRLTFTVVCTKESGWFTDVLHVQLTALLRELD